MKKPLLPILLVEDDANDVFFFTRAVGKAGIANPLVTVADGQQAIHYLGGTGPYTDRASHPLPALVVLDLNLPVKHGLEVLTFLRANPEAAHTIVVVLTSSIDALDMHEAYALGANSYIVKPADPNQLSAVVEAFRSYWLTLNSPPPPAGATSRFRTHRPTPS